MGFEDLCNIKLSLSLGCYNNKPDNNNNNSILQFNFQEKSLPSLKLNKISPSLTLSLSSSSSEEEASRENGHGVHGENSVVKRERDDASYEVEVDKVSWRVGDEQDNEEVGPRKKLRLSKEQSLILEDNFKVHSTLNPKQKQELAKRLNLRPRQVEVWFQNRRARIKMKQTEIDCELLKKYCETLTDDNRRLRKELQELKASKLSSPAPVYTISLCPSCERISSRAPHLQSLHL